MKMSHVWGLAGIFCVALVARDAGADIKAFHGASCMTFSDDPLEGFTGFHDAEGFTLFAPGADHTEVTCPLVRDRVDSADSLGNVYVEGRNQANVAGLFPFRCTLFSQHEDISGLTLDTDTLQTNTIGNVQLGPFNVTSSSGNEGSYALECTLQDEDTIYHVYVNENNSAAD